MIQSSRQSILFLEPKANGEKERESAKRIKARLHLTFLSLTVLNQTKAKSSNLHTTFFYP